MSISLRWRLTLWSTFTLAVVMALFLAFASLFLNNISNLFIYPAIDQNLKRLTTANQVQIMRNHSMTRTLQGSEQFGAVLFMVLDRNGNFVTGEQTVPWSAELFDRALAAPGGDGILDTVLMPDRTRVRVFLSPIDMLSPVSGELERQGVLVAATRLDVYDEIVNKAGTYLAGGALVLILIVGAGSFFLTGRALRAVNTVARRARQIESSQDLSQRIPQPRTDDEMGNLVRTFNAMLERLESAFAAQRRFVADSSHELRTPLTVIKGNLHLLRRTDDPAERTELINITEAEISRLNRMVNDLLYMAQMQSGHVAKPILRAVELDSLLLDIFALTRSMAALKDQRVALVHEDIASAYGDRDQLQHLLLNLVDNAVKYTPQGGMISIGMWAEQGWARIEVSDSGPGIAEEDLPMLFDRFFRSSEARQQAGDGAGLGLAIVKSIAEAHGGRVEAFSTRGQGTTFRVWLPTAAPATQPLTVDGVADEERRRIRGVPLRTKRSTSRVQEESWPNT